MGCRPGASFQYGFLVDEEEDEELYGKIEEMVEDKNSSLFGKVGIEYWGTDGYTGICVYAVGSGIGSDYAESGFELAPLMSMETEFKQTMEDFCREHNIDYESSWCLTASYM